MKKWILGLLVTALGCVALGVGLDELIILDDATPPYVMLGLGIVCLLMISDRLPLHGRVIGVCGVMEQKSGLRETDKTGIVQKS